MHAGLSLLPDAQPIILLTRHSIRVPADGQGFASYALPLTDLGRELAFAWGEYRRAATQRKFYACLTSPIERCVETALRMLDGAAAPVCDSTSQQLGMDVVRTKVLVEPGSFVQDAAKLTSNPLLRTLEGVSDSCPPHGLDVVKTKLLVEPGSFVQDASKLSAVFRQYGALKFINSFLAEQFEGMKQPSRGVVDILGLLHKHLPTAENSLLLAVSHDTILAAFLAVMHDSTEISCDDWPEMMEGVFLWFEGDHFESSRVHWVWRGVSESRLISSLVTTR